MEEEEDLENPCASTAAEEDYMDSCCSTPYVSAPSSPGRGTPLAGFYYSAPASPMHFVLSKSPLKSYPSAAPLDSASSFEFDFSATLPSASAAGSMTSADELFFNGQIRPMKLSAHLQRPHLDSDDVAEEPRGRELKFRAGSLRRRTRSMSPMRSPTTSSRISLDEKSIDASASADIQEEIRLDETTPRSSSAGRSSKRWIFLKEFLYRSKSEGRNEGHKFWSFSPVKDKKMAPLPSKGKASPKKKAVSSRGEGKRGISVSAHELHYTAKRAQAEEMRKKTFLPYRQGLFGCLGFSSKSYGTINGFARAFNTVSSR